MPDILEIVSKEAIDGLLKAAQAAQQLDSAVTNISKSQVAFAEKTKAFSAAQKESEKITKDQASALREIARDTKKKADADEKAAKATAEHNAALAMEVKSIEDARKQNKALAAERNKVNLTTAEGKKQVEGYNKAIDKNTEFIRKNADAETKRWMNVGKYKEAIMGLPGPLGRAANGVAGLGKQLWALVMNPIVAIVAAIVLAFTALYKILKSTDEGANFLDATFKAVGAIFDVIRQRVLIVVDAFKALFSGNFREAGEKFKESVSGIGEQMKNAAGEAWQLVYAMDALEDSMRANISKAADYENKIAKLRVLSKDQRLSDEERMKAAKEAMDLQRELADDQVRFMTEQYDLDIRDAARKVNLSKETVDALIKMDDKQFAEAIKNNEDYRRIANELGDEGVQKLEESYAKMIGADTAYFEGIRRQQSEYTGFVQEIQAKRAEEAKIAAEKAETERRASNLIGKVAQIDYTIQIEQAKTDIITGQLELREQADIDFTEREKERRKENIKAYFQDYQGFMNDLQNVGQALFAFNSQLIANEQVSLENAKAQELAIAGDNAEKRAKIEKKYDEELKRLRTRQAKADKAQAIFSSIINTAKAVVGSLPNLILAAIVGALGAAQTIAIAAQPIPVFAKGTRRAPRGLGLWGERGRELMIGRDGQMIMSPSTASLVNLKGGERIFSNRETELIMRAARGADDSGSRKMLDMMHADNLKLIETVKNKPVIHIDRKGTRINERNGDYFRTYLNRKLG